MRFLYITHVGEAAGANFFRAFSIARQMVRRGHDATVLCSSASSSPGTRRCERDGVEVIASADLVSRGSTRSGLSPYETAQRLMLLRDRRYDIVHTFGHRPTVSVPALAVRRWQGASVVADWSDLWGAPGIAAERSLIGRETIGAFDSWLERRILARADSLTVVTEYLAAIGQTWGVSRDRMFMVPTGANPDLIRPRSKDEAKLKLGLDGDGPVLLYSGRSAFDNDSVIRLCDRLRGRVPATVLVTLGGGARPQTQGGIVNLGWIPYSEQEAVLAAADFMLLPLDERPMNRARFPNRVGDYLAAGRPIVTAAGTEAGRFVEAHRIGVVTESIENATSILADLWNRQDELERMGRRARELAEGEYSWEALSMSVLVCYESLRPPGAL